MHHDLPGEVISSQDNDSKNFQAGQLALYHQNWENMGAPKVVLDLIQGYRIPFLQKPPLVHINVAKCPFQTPTSPEMSAIIRKMKAQSIIQPAKISASFVSPLFLVPKSDGSSRPIFNLKALNEYVVAKPFHLINMYRVPDFLQPQDWVCKIDLSQAYFHLRVTQSHRRFLRLVYNQELLEMTCLPFGLSTAPKTFAMLTNWIAQQLRERWKVRILVYLDDFLLVNQDPQVLRNHVDIVTQFLQELGWQINFQKSILTPQKEIVFLGILWKPWQNIKALPRDKVHTITQKVIQLLEHKKVTVKQMQRVVGLLNFASFVVPRGRLNHRHMLMFLNSLPNLSLEAFLIPQSIYSELKWWSQNCQLSTPIHYPPPVNFLVTDASDQAWGAQLNDQALWGSWTHEEQHLHCNQKELLAILHALQNHAQTLKKSSLLIQCDNRTAVAQLRKEGGTKSICLMTVTYQILTILDQHQIHFTIHHIPGRYNNQADHLSRLRQPPEWHLLPACVQMVFAKLGTPMIDLFASETAHVVCNYVSRDLRDRQALFHDAFSVPWHYPLAWVFPPPFLVPKVLSHLNQCSGIFLLVVPRWEKVFWRADLEARALRAPLTLTSLHKHLLDTSTGLAPPKVEHITLEVWKCGGGLRP